MTASRAPLRQIAARPVPRSMPSRRAKPKPTAQTKLLQRLQLIQNLSVTSAFVLTGCVFLLYGWTVHTQKSWNQQFSRLEHYKQLEGRLINAAEALNHDRIQQAWEQGDLVRETPDRVVFIDGLPPRPPVAQEPKQDRKSIPSLPIAY